jgi:hypothetical protein
VAGTFRSGYYDYDKKVGLVSFGAAQRFLNRGDVAKFVEVKIDDVFAIDSRKQVVQDLLQPYTLGDFLEDVSQSRESIEAVLEGKVSQAPIEKQPASVIGLLRNASKVLSVLRGRSAHTFTQTRATSSSRGRRSTPRSSRRSSCRRWCCRSSSSSSSWWRPSTSWARR